MIKVVGTSYFVATTRYVVTTEPGVDQDWELDEAGQSAMLLFGVGTTAAVSIATLNNIME